MYRGLFGEVVWCSIMSVWELLEGAGACVVGAAWFSGGVVGCVGAEEDPAVGWSCVLRVGWGTCRFERVVGGSGVGERLESLLVELAGDGERDTGGEACFFLAFFFPMLGRRVWAGV